MTPLISWASCSSAQPLFGELAFAHRQPELLLVQLATIDLAERSTIYACVHTEADINSEQLVSILCSQVQNCPFASNAFSTEVRKQFGADCEGADNMSGRLASWGVVIEL